MMTFVARPDIVVDPLAQFSPVEVSRGYLNRFFPVTSVRLPSSRDIPFQFLLRSSRSTGSIVYFCSRVVHLPVPSALVVFVVFPLIGLPPFSVLSKCRLLFLRFLSFPGTSRPCCAFVLLQSWHWTALLFRLVGWHLCENLLRQSMSCLVGLG